MSSWFFFFFFSEACVYGLVHRGLLAAVVWVGKRKIEEWLERKGIDLGVFISEKFLITLGTTTKKKKRFLH